MRWCGGTRKRASPQCASAAVWGSPSASSVRAGRKTRKGGGPMARVAVVTGGTRGIGRAISIALKNQGRTVIANYASDSAKADAFGRETGIETRKWDVSDFEACVAAVNAIATDLGPVEVLVNNAGIARDATMRKMTRTSWEQ